MNDIYFIGLIVSAFMLTANAEPESFKLWIAWELVWACIAIFFGCKLNEGSKE